MSFKTPKTPFARPNLPSLLLVFFVLATLFLIAILQIEAMDATSFCGALPQTKLSASNRNFSTSCPRARSVVSVARHLSEEFQQPDKLYYRESLVVSSSSSANKGMTASGRSYLSGPVMKRNPVGQAFCAASVVGVGAFCEGFVDSHLHVTEDKVGVLLLNLGGPETLNDVQPFLFNLFADPDIIRLPRLFQFLQKPLAKLISVLELLKADGIKIALKAKGLTANVYVGMRYWYPFTEEAIHQSRVGPVQWLKPYTDEVLVELGQKVLAFVLLLYPKSDYGIQETSSFKRGEFRDI
ncbi:hypothetical protein NC651_017003 [Populus alba x Populus x berolinensis]|nr:hypothetical protein NC651_017003 [Populus alba x Populus x berolinensis]